VVRFCSRAQCFVFIFFYLCALFFLFFLYCCVRDMCVCNNFWSHIWRSFFFLRKSCFTFKKLFHSFSSLLNSFSIHQKTFQIFANISHYLRNIWKTLPLSPAERTAYFVDFFKKSIKVQNLEKNPKFTQILSKIWKRFFVSNYKEKWKQFYCI
jgi:hypothetical protein